MCFDEVIVPTMYVGSVFHLLGESRFDKLLRDGILQFVSWEGHDSVWFQSKTVGFGHLVTGNKQGGTIRADIERQLSAIPGKEEEARGPARPSRLRGQLIASRFSYPKDSAPWSLGIFNKLLVDRIEQRTHFVDLAGGRNFAEVCNGLLVSPLTRSMLGISDATPAGNIPRWAAHQVLRVVQVARLGATCHNLGISSMGLTAGMAEVAQVAFSTLAGGALAADAAAYTLTGEFGLIEEDAVVARPEIWDAIIQFRNTVSGGAFQAEILSQLKKNQGAELTPAIDATMRQTLPSAALAQARKQMATLMIAKRIEPVVPAMWSDTGQFGPRIWLPRTLQKFEEYLVSANLDKYDLCPCGSYEKVKFCCLAAMRL